MVWGCLSAKGVGALTGINGIMNNAPMYVGILRDYLLLSATKFGIRDSFKLYQDNDPQHRAYLTFSQHTSRLPCDVIVTTIAFQL
jgi:hypothetical protein